MSRKDTDKDSERPHYYSQFWLDIAAGRRVIGGPKPEDEQGEPEIAEPASPRRNFRNANNDYQETIAHPQVDSYQEEPEVIVDPEVDDFDMAEDDVDIPNINVDDDDIPDVDMDIADEDEDFYDEEEEEDDDMGWGGRGRKKAKPARQPKQPPKRTPKRETRRNF